MNLKRIMATLVVVALAPLLTSCTGGKRERPEPPRISIQSLKVDGTQVAMQLRLTNQSFGPMVFESLTVSLSIAGISAASERAIALNQLRVPGRGTEVVPFVVNSAELAVAAGQPSLSYRLAGNAVSDGGEFPFVLDSVLNEVPGTPGEFR
jgi:LEA14-like dessication related protein